MMAVGVRKEGGQGGASVQFVVMKGAYWGHNEGVGLWRVGSMRDSGAESIEQSNNHPLAPRTPPTDPHFSCFDGWIGLGRKVHPNTTRHIIGPPTPNPTHIHTHAHRPTDLPSSAPSPVPSAAGSRTAARGGCCRPPRRRR